MVGFGVLLGVIVLGTLGYCLIEGWSLLDAVYMTVIALSTVGFGEVHHLSDRGRLFTIALIFMGILNMAFLVNSFTDAMIQGYFQEGFRLQRQRQLMNRLSQHYVLCGFGRTGAQIAEEFVLEQIPVVIIDRDEDVILRARNQGFLTVQGDATGDDVLIQAGIERALCLVTALPSDAENLYSILSARALNAQLRTIARANTAEAIQKLQRAGADMVISPQITGGKRMAAAALRPQVLDFVDGILSGNDRAFYLEEFRLEVGRCPYLGKTLGEAQLRSPSSGSGSGALVLAIRRHSGELCPDPAIDTMLQSGDVLICLGTGEQLRLLNQHLGPLPTDLPPREPQILTGS